MHFALDAVAVDEDARIEKGLPRMHWSRWNIAAANVFECVDADAKADARADAFSGYNKATAYADTRVKPNIEAEACADVCARAYSYEDAHADTVAHGYDSSDADAHAFPGASSEADTHAAADAYVENENEPSTQRNQ